MRDTIKKFTLGMAATMALTLPLTVHAADATSFNPTTVKVTAKPISSIPVGTIIAWPVAQNPADWRNPDGSYNWLECNGQNFSQAAYPELFALLGGKLPDLRGLFLRGHGGKSAGLMVKQDDAGRNVTGTFSSDALFSSQFNGSYSPTGAFFSETVNGAHIASDGHAGFQVMKLDASRIWGKNHATDSANGEFRPANQAVRYLVRARP